MSFQKNNNDNRTILDKKSLKVYPIPRDWNRVHGKTKNICWRIFTWIIHITIRYLYRVNTSIAKNIYKCTYIHCMYLQAILTMRMTFQQRWKTVIFGKFHLLIVELIEKVCIYRKFGSHNCFLTKLRIKIDIIKPYNTNFI